MVGISETQLVGDNTIDINNYKWIGRNRQVTNGRGSGGIGFLINHRILNAFNVNELIVDNDNVLGISM